VWFTCASLILLVEFDLLLCEISGFRHGVGEVFPLLGYDTVLVAGYRRFGKASLSFLGVNQYIAA
jgi:hypothetical protein